jgi:hypothetical protein
MATTLLYTFRCEYDYFVFLPLPATAHRIEKKEANDCTTHLLHSESFPQQRTFIIQEYIVLDNLIVKINASIL